ncbi:hypothetical protein AB1Y20_021307 [Prymnesium parvum]|uniref:C3H1-type domain-containing protein n=1 Tax=Prymnesium parvum TaxID=97485 RepID=A0AB34JL68_PRYPA
MTEPSEERPLKRPDASMSDVEEKDSDEREPKRGAERRRFADDSSRPREEMPRRTAPVREWQRRFEPYRRDDRPPERRDDRAPERRGDRPLERRTLAPSREERRVERPRAPHAAAEFSRPPARPELDRTRERKEEKRDERRGEKRDERRDERWDERRGEKREESSRGREELRRPPAGDSWEWRQGSAKRICRNWAQTGACKAGSSCAFAHERKGAPGGGGGGGGGGAWRRPPPPSEKDTWDHSAFEAVNREHDRLNPIRAAMKNFEF